MARRRNRQRREDLHAFSSVRFEEDAKIITRHRVGKIYRYATMDQAKLQAATIRW